MLWRNGIILAFIFGAGVMAYQIGARLSDEAITTIAGVVCGVFATIPISVGLLIALTRERPAEVEAEYIDIKPAPEPYQVYRPSPPPAPPAQIPPQPQIIVVAPPNAPLSQNYFPYGSYAPPPSAPALPAPMQERTFKIIGEQDDD